jgi:hypothetical protein
MEDEIGRTGGWETRNSRPRALFRNAASEDPSFGVIELLRENLPVVGKALRLGIAELNGYYAVTIMTIFRRRLTHITPALQRLASGAFLGLVETNLDSVPALAHSSWPSSESFRHMDEIYTQERLYDDEAREALHLLATNPLLFLRALGMLGDDFPHDCCFRTVEDNINWRYRFLESITSCERRDATTTEALKEKAVHHASILAALLRQQDRSDNARSLFENAMSACQKATSRSFWEADDEELWASKYVEVLRRGNGGERIAALCKRMLSTPHTKHSIWATRLFEWAVEAGDQDLASETVGDHLRYLRAKREAIQRDYEVEEWNLEESDWQQRRFKVMAEDEQQRLAQDMVTKWASILAYTARHVRYSYKYDASDCLVDWATSLAKLLDNGRDPDEVKEKKQEGLFDQVELALTTAGCDTRGKGATWLRSFDDKPWKVQLDKRRLEEKQRAEAEAEEEKQRAEAEAEEEKRMQELRYEEARRELQKAPIPPGCWSVNSVANMCAYTDVSRGLHRVGEGTASDDDMVEAGFDREDLGLFTDLIERGDRLPGPKPGMVRQFAVPIGRLLSSDSVVVEFMAYEAVLSLSSILRLITDACHRGHGVENGLWLIRDSVDNRKAVVWTRRRWPGLYYMDGAFPRWAMSILRKIRV